MGASTLLLLLSGPQPGRVTSLPPSSLQPCGRIGELWVLFCLLAAAQQLLHCVAGSAGWAHSGFSLPVGPCTIQVAGAALSGVLVGGGAELGFEGSVFSKTNTGFGS